MAGKKKLVIAAAAAGSVGAVACGLSWKIVTRSMGGSRQTYGQALKWQSEHYDTGFFDALEKEEYSVRSTDGYELHALFCRNPRPLAPPPHASTSASLPPSVLSTNTFQECLVGAIPR